MKMEFHPLANIFPAIPEDEQNELADDIKLFGLRQPIITYQKMILDGRHRYDACLEVDVEPIFVEFTGDDPLTFVISMNLMRRHLNTSQRAFIAAKLENMPPGNPTLKKNPSTSNSTYQTDKSSKTPIFPKQVNSPPLQNATIQQPSVTRARAAEIMNVSPDLVKSAAKVLKEAPALAEQGVNGNISVNAAVKQVVAQKAKEEVVLDKVGRAIPPKILPLWRQAEAAAKEAMDALSKIRCALRVASEENNILYREMIVTSTMGHLNNAYGDYQTVAPYAVCHLCQGKLTDKCGACKERGFVSKFRWDTCVPKEFKTIFTNGK